ncbi:hypothetical protein LguiA_018282 [Lonicera macranthoides]
MYNRKVENACFEKEGSRWHVVVKNEITGGAEEYMALYLEVATGENSQGFISDFTGLEEFKGEGIHLSEYEVGNVLLIKMCWLLVVVILAWRLLMICRVGMLVLPLLFAARYIIQNYEDTIDIVDNTRVMLSKLKYGDLTGYGLERPTRGPFFLKKITGRSPVIDVGTIDKIKDGSIQDGGSLFNEDGMPKPGNQSQWKGENGLYCAGFSKNRLFGISNDAQNIADDIKKALE